MASLFILVPISLLLLGIAIWGFVWAVRGGQYDDLDSPAIDILRSDPADAVPEDSSETNRQNSDAD